MKSGMADINKDDWQAPHRQSAIARKLLAYAELPDDDLAALAALQGNRRTVEAGEEIPHRDNDRKYSAFLLTSGWVCSYKLLRDGSRQIIDFRIPGDFLRLRSFMLQTSGSSLEAITRVELIEFATGNLLRTLGERPRLAAALLWSASRDEAAIVEHLIDIGRRSALVRTAHFLLELRLRLQLVGLATPSGYDCPLSQYLLGDALGLSAIHLNRILRKLRESGLVTFRKGTVTFNNLSALMELAEFDRDYLDQGRPRLPKPQNG